MFGIEDKRLRQRLLQKTELTLVDAVKICHASELALHHAKMFSGDADKDGAAVAMVSTRTQRPREAHVKRHKETETFDCKQCGFRHASKKCPAYVKVCGKCKGLNHFAKCCFSKGKKSQSERIRVVEETALSDTFFVGMVMQGDTGSTGMETSVNTVEQDPWMVALHVNGAVIKFKLDTGH